MKTLFPPDFFIQNRQALQKQHKGLIVMTGNGMLQRSGDTTFPFRQDSSFWYLTGIDEPGVLLVMTPEQSLLIVPGREKIREAFDGTLDIAKMTQISGVDTVLGEDDGWQYIATELQKNTSVFACLPSPAYIASHDMYTNPARHHLCDRLKDLSAKELDIQDIRPTLARMRVIKQAPELKAIQKAVDVSIQAFSEVREKLQTYSNECEVDAAITSSFMRNTYGHAYSPIVASGVHACTLHYVVNKAKLTSKDLLLIDAGAEVSHYAADITRTYAQSKPAKRQQDIHAAVLRVQDYAVSLLRPGIKLKDYEQSVETRMGEELQALGLITTIDKASVRRYFPHATSHFLGLDVHDVGDYKEPLKPGMVLTVEPGIYVAAEGIGIRIEDNVVITENGCQVLSKSLPRSLT